MRAATRIYEHPELTDSDIWTHGAPSKAVVVGAVAGVVSLAAAAAYTICVLPLNRKWSERSVYVALSSVVRC